VAGWGAYDQTGLPAGLSNVVAIAAGLDFSLVLKSDGTVASWGNPNQGRTNVPAGLSNVVAIAAGYYHSLALRSDGVVVSWGNNSQGQTNVPVGLSNVVNVAAGWFHSLAVKSDGTVVGWGAGTFVADPPDSINYGQAMVPAGLSNIVAIAAGQQLCSFAIVAKLRINSARLTNQFPAIQFRTFSGQQYSVEYSPDLSSGSWLPLPGGSVSGDGHDAQVTDTNGVVSGARFYRVKQQ